jgi:hypothetical protein
MSALTTWRYVGRHDFEFREAGDASGYEKLQCVRIPDHDAQHASLVEPKRWLPLRTFEPTCSVYRKSNPRNRVSVPKIK